MKHVLLFLLITFSFTANAQTVKKWVDEQGKVHYGDSKAARDVKGAETVNIKDTFDEKAYREGIRRHEDTEKIADQLEQERLAEEEQKRQEEAEREASKPVAPGGGITGAPARRTRNIEVPPGKAPARPGTPANPPAR